VGSRHVFLDLAQGRYFMLEGAGAEHFDAFAGNQASDDDLLWLTEHGIIEPGIATRTAIALAPPAASVLDDAPGKISLWLVGEALVALARARQRLARKPLETLFRPGRTGMADAERSRAVAVAFQHTARFVSAKDQCLVRGLALKTMLARRGLAAEFVIGVTLPFSAHCWVQSGSIVLSDPLDRVLGFEPLLAVP
jgi:hypothetical protein